MLFLAMGNHPASAWSAGGEASQTHDRADLPTPVALLFPGSNRSSSRRTHRRGEFLHPHYTPFNSPEHDIIQHGYYQAIETSANNTGTRRTRTRYQRFARFKRGHWQSMGLDRAKASAMAAFYTPPLLVVDTRWFHAAPRTRSITCHFQLT
jgi:hypothetical protein